MNVEIMDKEAVRAIIREELETILWSVRQDIIDSGKSPSSAEELLTKIIREVW